MNNEHPEHDPDVIEPATRMFDHARKGHTTTLTRYLDAGLPADLTNDKGDTLLMPAAYHGHTDTVAALLHHGADPDAGTPTARETARMFDKQDLLTLLEH